MHLTEKSQKMPFLPHQTDKAFKIYRSEQSELLMNFYSGIITPPPPPQYVPVINPKKLSYCTGKKGAHI